MIFLGTKVIQHKLPDERQVCPNCMSVTEHAVVDVDTRFTLYLIPLFSIKREAIYRCLTCGDTHSVDYYEYQARHEDAAPPPQWTVTTPAPETNGGAPQTGQEKARVILEGKVIDGKAEKLHLPFQLAALPVLRYLWIAFGLIALLGLLVLFIVFRLLAR